MRGLATLVAYVLSITFVSAVLIAALTIIISPVDDSQSPIVRPANAYVAAPRPSSNSAQKNPELKPAQRPHAVAKHADGRTLLSRTADYWAFRKSGVY